MKGDQTKKEWNSFREKGPNFGRNANTSEYGILVEDNNGGRFDLNQLDYFCKQNMSDEALIEEVGWGTWNRNIRGIEKRRAQSKPVIPDFKREVILIQCKPGVGKSRWVQKNYPDYYSVPIQTGANWWDGYCGQETVLIDEFEGEMYLSNLLRILDQYIEAVPIKGGFTWLTAKRIIVISNSHPSTWYEWNRYQGKDRSDKQFALRRRFIDYGFIMAWTEVGLDEVDILDYWPLKESDMDSSTWHCYKRKIKTVNDLIRAPVNEIIIEDNFAMEPEGYPEYYKSV